MRKPARVSWTPLFLLCLSVGCAGMRPPGSAPGTAGLHVRQMLLVSTAEGDRAFLLRLSGRPLGIRHTMSRDGSRIEVELRGAGGEGLPEREVEQADPHIRAVRLAKNGDSLRVTLELRSRPPGGYQVQEMADWIVIRFPSPRG